MTNTKTQTDVATITTKDLMNKLQYIEEQERKLVRLKAKLDALGDKDRSTTINVNIAGNGFSITKGSVIDFLNNEILVTQRTIKACKEDLQLIRVKD